VKLHLASQADHGLINTVLCDMTVLEMWAALIRNRWNNTPSETIQKWFIVPDAYVEFVQNTAQSALTSPAASLRGAVSEGVSERLRGTGAETLRQNLDVLVRDAVREEVLACRMVPYGPERVLSYYLSLRIEIENLRLALASVTSGIDAKTVMERFRREYA
jgi:vacuolar-type H+-ATPase subunit C/Vma6